MLYEKNTLTLFEKEMRRIGESLVDDDIEMVLIDDGSKLPKR